MTSKKIFQLFITELNKNKIKMTRVFFSIFISLLIFSSVTILKNCVESEINNNSRLLLGGDFEISSKNKPLSLNQLSKLKERFTLTEVIEFTSIIQTEKRKSKTTRLKVIDNLYPLIGVANVEPPESLEILKKFPNKILINETTRNNLGLKLGDKIKIQKTSFEIAGVIKSLPDIGEFFLFGDQALINSSSFKRMQINNLGSFIKFKYKMIKKDNKKIILEDVINDESLVVKFPQDVSLDIQKIIESFIYFLSIISASAILIAGIGLKNSLFSFLSDNQINIAIYKSLGLSSFNIKTLYYLQTIIILIFCSLGAYILGLLIISLLNYNLFNFLNIDLHVKFRIHEYLIIQSFSFIIFFIFAKPVLNNINRIRVTDLFRNSCTQLNFSYKMRSIFEISIFLGIFVVSFCYINVKPKETLIFFLFFTIISFFYFFLSKYYIYFFNKIKNIQNISMLITIKNLKGFHTLNSIVIITMGLGLTILFFLAIFSSNINKEIHSSTPKNAPHYFFLGIQKSELNLFSEQIREIDRHAEQIVVPMISSRIVAINKRKPKEIIKEDNKSFWFINGERRISWAKDPPLNNPVVKGEWWDNDDGRLLKLSLDKKVAKDLKLKIGDSLTFNIYGNLVSGTITNLRKVDYRDLNINFAILFNPKYASKIPHEFISTIKFKNENSINFSNLLSKLPALSYIRLSEYVNKIKNYLNKLFVSSILISSLVILIGLIVISNAVSVIGNLKIYQNLVLTILGFSKHNILLLIAFETLILFIPIVLFSLIFSIMFSYIFITNFLSMNWYLSFYVIVAISISFLFVLFLTLLVSNRKYLKFNPYNLLKNG